MPQPNGDFLCVSPLSFEPFFSLERHVDKATNWHVFKTPAKRSQHINTTYCKHFHAPPKRLQHFTTTWMSKVKDVAMPW